MGELQMEVAGKEQLQEQLQMMLQLVTILYL